MNWKIIGPSALINAALTIVLSSIFFPLFFLGPLTGGFLASYLSKGYEDYDKMDKIDGAVVGGISGLAGGLIVLGFGVVSVIIGLISAKTGLIATNILIIGFFIFKFLGIAGGIIGVIAKE